MGYNKFYISGNGNECPLQASYLFMYFICDVNMTSLSRSWHWWAGSVCCMCGEACSSRWLMTKLTNGQHACVLVFMPMVDILNIILWLSVCFLRTWWTLCFTPRLMQQVAGNILRVHYKSMKCDVSFSQGSVSTLFRWGEHVFMYL